MSGFENKPWKKFCVQISDLMRVQGNYENNFLPIKNLFKEYLREEDEGASFSVVKNQKILVNIFGKSVNLDNAWNENTIVNTFSLSKGIYCGCLLKLLDKKEIDIDKEISFYWKKFGNANKKNITLRHVLSHQSGVYRFKTKVSNEDLLDWEKINTLLENQEPDHIPGKFNFYHAKTHGYIICNVIKLVTGLDIDDFLHQEVIKDKKFNFYFKNNNNRNCYDLICPEVSNKIKNYDELTTFNNPSHDINFFNSKNFRKGIVPSLGGHGSALAIASFFDFLANDLKNDTHNIIKKNTFEMLLKQTSNKIDNNLKMNIKWTHCGLILRGGWMFGKNKDSFGHNGWGGSIGFADPKEGIGISFITRKINPTMGSDARGVNLIKKLYELL